MKLTRLSAAVAAAAIAPAVLFASPASAADGAQPPANSAPDKASEAKPETKDGEASKSAAKQDEDNRFAILRMLDGKAGRGLEREANKALNGTAEDRRHFLEVGQYKARLEDDRVRVAQIMSRGGYAVQQAGSKALDGGADAIKEFLEKGQYAAQREDDEVRVSQIINAGGPAVKEAGKKALRGTYEDVKHFLETGQYEARKKDEAAEEAAKKKPAEDKKDAEKSSTGDGHKKDADRDGTKPAQDGGKSSVKAASAKDAKDAPATASAKGGEMASTGADASVPWALGGGAAAVAAGAGMVVLARRRRAAEQG
ncbi:ALF repeat-containing protein [Streptomyces sp. NPDC001404]|uniref:ALF repeat-containing protein n=1 Tax=Streptomyces sp. NPDC001404 TaxID=3364571 RepID=UPI0036804468